MADEQDKPQGAGGLKFRLPRLFAESGEGQEESPPPEPAAAAAAPPGRRSIFAAAIARPPAGESAQASVEMAQLHDALERIAGLLEDMNQRESAQEKVFNTLHQELSDYKKDFIYEHLKPVVRPLLFLYDSLDQFDEELSRHERPASQEKRSSLPPSLVRQNLDYFREQLTEALRVCEVTKMETPSGEYTARLHKAVEVVPVAAEQANHIQRVVRSGWYLNGQLLRQAEVVIGRSD